MIGSLLLAFLVMGALNDDGAPIYFVIPAGVCVFFAARAFGRFLFEEK